MESERAHSVMTDRTHKKYKRSPAPVHLWFAPAKRDFIPHQVEWAKSKLRAKWPHEVEVVDKWGPQVSHVVASVFTDENEIGTASGTTPAKVVLPNDMLALCGQDAASVDPVAFLNALPDDKWKTAKKKKPSLSSASRSPFTQERETKEQWMQRIPEPLQEACQNYLELGDYLGIEPVRELEVQPKATDDRINYFCFKSGNSELVRPNVNQKLTYWFAQLQDYYEATAASEKDKWRATSYKKAVQTLSNYQFEITKASQLQGRRNFGPKMLKKVNEILRDGKLQKAIELTSTEEYKALKELVKVHGVGSKVSRDLYKLGLKTIKDLRSPRGQKAISEISRRALHHFEDLQERIPRGEVRAIGERIKVAVKELWPDQGIYGEIVGSFRRGKPDCGDIDLIFSSTGTGCPPIAQLIVHLRKQGIILEDLVDICSKSLGKVVLENQSYMGICRLGPGKLARRLDIKFYPKEVFPFALLHFTGNDHFNRSIRHYCRMHNMSLSDAGLFPALRRGREGIAKGNKSLLEAKSEQDIFKALGLPYKSPCERNEVSQDMNVLVYDRVWKGDAELYARVAAYGEENLLCLVEDEEEI